MTNHVETAHAHANEAERLLTSVHEHIVKRGRKLGLEQHAESTLAGTHASLATFYLLLSRD